MFMVFALVALSSPVYAKFNPGTIVIFSDSSASALHPYVDTGLTWPTSEEDWRNFPKWGHYMAWAMDAHLVNYSFAGATSGDMLSAVGDYLASGPALGFGDRVHLIRIGANDGYLRSFPIMDQDILDHSKATISEMASLLLEAGAKYVYIMDGSANGRTPFFYHIAAASASDPTDQEEVDQIFNSLSAIFGNNVQEANEQIWEQVFQDSPGARRLQTSGFFPELENHLLAYGFGENSFVYCYLTTREEFPCLGNEYSESAPQEDINKLVYWDGAHIGPAAHSYFAEFVTDFIQMQDNSKYKKGYKFKHNSSFRSSNR